MVFVLFRFPKIFSHTCIKLPIFSPTQQNDLMGTLEDLLVIDCLRDVYPKVLRFLQWSPAETRLAEFSPYSTLQKTHIFQTPTRYLI